MEESWLEKLKRLLTEYDPFIKKDWEYTDNHWYFVYIWWSAIYGKEIWMLKIISKEYWFIKRLVENDKIDTSKAKDKNLNGYEIELRIRAVKELVADSEEKTVLYLNLLMILSISDTPIEDLLLYLK